MKCLKSHLNRFFIVSVVAIALDSCTLGPNFKAPDSTLPAKFDLGTSKQASLFGSGENPGAISEWWKSFGDAELSSLIETAISSNFDVRIALQRVAEARAIDASADDSWEPQLNFDAGVARGSGSAPAKARVPSALDSGRNNNGIKEVVYETGFDSAWELDLFGRFRRLAEAAHADALAMQENKNDVVVTLVAEVGRNYVDLRALQDRLRIAEENVKVSRKTFDLVQKSFKNGLINELDVTLAERQYETANAAIDPLRERVRQVERRLAVLVAKDPSALYAQLDVYSKQLVPPPTISVGLPGDLLARRPDIRAAQQTLAAETARVGIAEADFFPRVTLIGAIGEQGAGLGRSGPSDSMYSIGPAVRFPLLDSGQLDANLQIQNLKVREADLKFRQSLLKAVEEVDDSLGAYSAQRSRYASLERAVKAGERSAHIAMERYNLGLTDFLNALEAQRQLFSLQDQLAATKQEVLSQMVALYKALGGGWQLDAGRHVPDASLKPAIVKTIPIALTARKNIAPEVYTADTTPRS